eukprot:s2996_g8.t1
MSADSDGRSFHEIFGHRNQLLVNSVLSSLQDEVANNNHDHGFMNLFSIGGIGYQQDVKSQVQVISLGDAAWQDPRVAPLAPPANGWQFQGTMPSRELNGLHFAMNSR